MAEVNYFVLGELFSLLERIELIDDVAFADFDPDDEKDVEAIVRKFIEPSISEAAPDNRVLLCNEVRPFSTNERSVPGTNASGFGLVASVLRPDCRISVR